MKMVRPAQAGNWSERNGSTRTPLQHAFARTSCSTLITWLSGPFGWLLKIRRGIARSPTPHHHHRGRHVQPFECSMVSCPGPPSGSSTVVLKSIPPKRIMAELERAGISTRASKASRGNDGTSGKLDSDGSRVRANYARRPGRSPARPQRRWITSTSQGKPDEKKLVACHGRERLSSRELASSEQCPSHCCKMGLSDSRVQELWHGYQCDQSSCGVPITAMGYRYMRL